MIIHSSTHSILGFSSYRNSWVELTMCSMTRLGPILVLHQPWRLHLSNNSSGYLIPHTSDSANHIPILWIIISPSDPVIGSCTVDVCRHNGLSESSFCMGYVLYGVDSTKHRLVMYSICHLLVARGPKAHTAVDRSKYINFQGYFVFNQLNMQVN